jgi:hypothetical protein
MSLPSPDLRYATAARFYRAALLLGLVAHRDVIEWADAMLEADPAPSVALIDVALDQGASRSSLHDALSALAGQPFDTCESREITGALLDLVRRDYYGGRATLAITVRRIGEVGRLLSWDDTFRWELMAFEDDHALIEDGIAGDWPTFRNELREWLAQFAGAADALRACTA